VKVRNHWSKEFSGKWKNNSPEWSSEDRERLKVAVTDDLTFWTTLSDFSSMLVCRYNKNFVYSSKEMKNTS
jgi:hypothetical protein